MPNYFVSSDHNNDGLNDKEIIDFINKKRIILGHRVISIFRDASGYPTSVFCSCKKYHRMIQGMPDCDNVCDKNKIHVPAIIYDNN